jgi:hypothetical protein
MGTGGTSSGGSWPSFLRGEDDHEIFSRLGECDPLRLRERSARRLRERWILVEPDRAYVRALAACAHAARREPPPVDLDSWVLSKIDLAIDQIVQADGEAERVRPDVVENEEKQFQLLTECLFIEPDLVRSTTVTFNALDDLARRAFFELCIEGRELPEVVESGPWDEGTLYEAIQAALAPFGLDVGAEADDDPEEEGEET